MDCCLELIGALSYGTVIAYISVLQEPVRKVRAPFLIWPVRLKILFQQIFKHSVVLPLFRSWLFRADDGAQPRFPVHIFMDGGAAVMVFPAFQINCHAAVTVNAVMAVIDLGNLSVNF